MTTSSEFVRRGEKGEASHCEKSKRTRTEYARTRGERQHNGRGVDRSQLSLSNGDQVEHQSGYILFYLRFY